MKISIAGKSLALIDEGKVNEHGQTGATVRSMSREQLARHERDPQFTAALSAADRASLRALDE